MPTENKMGAGELLLVAAAVAWYFCATTHVSPGDRDMGLDPWQYLGNALAVARGEWGLFHPWRGVLHGWLVGKLMVPVGDLRRAAELLSLVSMCGAVLGTWFLGRLLLGRWVGILAAWMFAIQPDLALFGMYHGVYGLLTVLVVLGLIGLAWTVRTMEAGRSFWVAAFVTGALFGLAWASDGRGLGIGIAGAVGLVVVGLMRTDGDFEIGLRRPLLAAAVLMVAMVGVGRGVSSIQKVEPLPFAEHKSSFKVVSPI